MNIDLQNWTEFAAPSVDPALWTAVVPAAGRGSRLGFDKPKILYPVAGQPIIDWLLRLLLPACSRIVFVLSPDGRDPVEQYLTGRWPADRCETAVQEVPTGMGDAVHAGLAHVRTPLVCVVWGDQVALRSESVQACLRLQQGRLRPDMTVPTVFRDNPYIHFERNENGRIRSLLQAREGDRMPPRGESDTGFFCFRTEALRELLTEVRRRPEQTGAATREFNLLPIIPLAAQQDRTVLTPHVMKIEETVGINSADDARHLETWLRSCACP
jgi:bifunctional N-acetylglucosamine-1-phosphate-uridyltransferase/glucosamine-1-phosphate-acetyltransferase GlmU-like protein